MSERFFLQPMRVDHIPAVSAIERLCFTQPWPAHAYRKEIQENRMAHYIVARVAEEGAEARDPGDKGANGANATVEVGAREVAPPVASSIVASGQASSLIERLSRLLRPGYEPHSPELDAELRSVVGYAGLWLMVDEAHITTIAVHPRFQGRGIGELLLLGLTDHAIGIGAKWLTLEVRISNEVAQALYRKYTFKEMGVRKGYYSDNREDALVMWTERLDSPQFLQALERNRARHAERLLSRG
jgi:ribosomal-protein-alanine N-acetyltransferase